MKKLLSTLCFVLFLTSCSTESVTIPEVTPESLDVKLTPSSLSLGVDEMAVVEVESSGSLQEVVWKGEGVTRSISAFELQGLGSNLELFFQFPRVGSYPVNLEFTDVHGVTLQKQLVFNVQRGNTVQITKIEVHNYLDKGNSWDPEFSDENPERLADIVLALEKTMSFNFSKKEFSTGSWFISEVHKNESSFTWELMTEKLYVNPLNSFHFGLADEDEGGMAQNLMLDYPTRFVDLRPYMEERPASIDFNVESIGLEVTFHLDWP